MNTTTPPTHAEEVKRAVRWAYEDWDALYVLEEHQLPAWLREDKQNDRDGRKRRESPDVFALLRSGNTLVIEVKVDEKDERRDHEKDHREYGMGDIRVKLCPPYIIEPHEVTVQSGWQLYWHHLDTDQIECKVELEDAIYIHNVNVKRERLFLAHGKLQERSGKGKAGKGAGARTGNFPDHLIPLAAEVLRADGCGPLKGRTITDRIDDSLKPDSASPQKLGNWFSEEGRAGRFTEAGIYPVSQARPTYFELRLREGGDE